MDSRRSRHELHRAAFKDHFGCWKLWMDLGNDRTTGQVVLGTPRSKSNTVLHMLPCATELHPEIMDLSVPEDEAPSCSAAESLTRQDLMVNKMIATLALDMLWRLFRDGKTDIHARYFDLATSSLTARAVPEKRKRATRSPRPGSRAKIRSPRAHSRLEKLA